MFCRNSKNNGGAGMYGNGMQYQQEMNNNTTTTNFADSINRWLVQVRNQQQPPITMPNNAMANNNSNNNQQQQRERTVSISCSSIGTNTSSFDVISGGGGGGGHKTSISMFPTLAPQCGYGIFYPVANPNNPFIAHFEELNRLPLDYWLLKKNGAGGGNGGNATTGAQPPKNASSCGATLSVANPVAAFSSPYPQHANSSASAPSVDQLAAMLSQVSTLRSGIEQVEQQLKRMVLEKSDGMEVEEENGRNEEEESRRTTHTYSIGSGAGDAATMEADDGADEDDDDKTEREMEGTVKQENDEHPGFCFNTVITTPAPYKFISLEDFLPKKPANAPLKLPTDPTYWLKKYPPPKPNRPMNEMAEDLSCWQSVLGWKSILEKIHASGEDVWLAPSSRAIKN